MGGALRQRAFFYCPGWGPIRKRKFKGCGNDSGEKWAIWRVGQPSCSKCIVTRRLVSITYDLGPIVKASYLRQLTRELSLNSIQNQSITAIWPSLSRIVAISLSSAVRRLLMDLALYCFFPVYLS